MPYQNEPSNHLSNQKAMENAPMFSHGLTIKKRDPAWIRIDEIVYQSDKIAPKRVIVLDGSKYLPDDSSDLENLLCFFNVDQCVIEIDKLETYLKSSFPNPQEYKKIFNHQPISTVLPILGLINEDYPQEADLFRYSIFNFLSSQNPLIDSLENSGLTFKIKENILDTLAALSHHDCKIESAIQPCLVCKKAGFVLSGNSFSTEEEGHYMGMRQIIACKCQSPTSLFITDLLGLHEQLDEDTIPALTSQMMLVFEKLILINTIRNLAINGHQGFLKETVFILDGTLSLYSHASWLSQAIAKELFEIQKNNDIALIGVEKTGGFVKNFNNVDDYFTKQGSTLENSMIYFLENHYIKSFIKKYDSDNFYGEKNYFGKKLFYKNKNGKKYVINMIFVDEQDKEINIDNRNDLENINKNKLLPQIIYILDNFASNAYPDALSLISMAHEGAALAANQTAKNILDSFLRQYINK